MTGEKATKLVRAGTILPLLPLCGGLPPQVAWGYLRARHRCGRSRPIMTARSREPTTDIAPLRVVVWSTGGIGSNAVRAIAQRPELELVGVWVHASEKDGREVSELCLGGPSGLKATEDADALIRLRPDCVVYAASGPERDAGAVPDYERLLKAGINVVTTTSTKLVFPPVYEQVVRERLATAAIDGGASLYASGIFPGFAATSSHSSPRLSLAGSTPFEL